MSRRFTCERCQVSFDSEWSEEEAKQEYELSPWNVPGQEAGVVCDDCFEEFKDWFESTTCARS